MSEIHQKTPKPKAYRLGGSGCNRIKGQKGLLCSEGLYWWKEWRNSPTKITNVFSVWCSWPLVPHTQEQGWGIMAAARNTPLVVIWESHKPKQDYNKAPYATCLCTYYFPLQEEERRKKAAIFISLYRNMFMKTSVRPALRLWWAAQRTSGGCWALAPGAGKWVKTQGDFGL